MKAYSLVCLGVVALVGCADDDDFSESFGDGSGTLRLEMRIEAEPVSGEQALSADQMRTQFRADVYDASGNEVSGVTIEVDTSNGSVTLAEGSCNGERRYCAQQPGYTRGYTIGARKGDDLITGIRVAGPRFFEVTAPEAASSVDATVPLLVTWSPQDDAQSVELDSEELELTLPGDPGEYEIPVGGLNADEDEIKEEHVRIKKERRVQLNGGLPGSDLRFEVENGVEFLTLPTAMAN